MPANVKRIQGDIVASQHEGSASAEKSSDSRLKALIEWVAKETGASYVCLLLWDHCTSELQEATWYGQKEAPEGLVAVARRALSKGEPVCLPGDGGAKEIVGSRLHALPLICAPVGSNATPLGVFAMGWPPSAGEGFSRWLPTARFVAGVAGALLENASFQRELQRSEEQVRELIRSTLDTQETERERICLEVHDGVTQTLVAAFQHLQALEAVPFEGIQWRQLLLRASALVKQAIQESREVINSLLPATLKDLGIVATLRQEMRQLEQETRWKVEFEADAVRLPADIETGLYRIIHEAITNAKKHAETNRLRVNLASADDRLKVEVRDWGKGFNYNPQDMSRRRGTGLVSMRRRAELLQGVCDIRSSPGQGTAVRIEIPFSHYRR